MCETLEDAVRGLIGVLRYIFEEDKVLLRTIDSAYEETLVEELKLIPKQFSGYVLRYINSVLIFYKCFDIQTFNSYIKSVPLGYFVDELFVDTYSYFLKFINNYNIDKANKARIINITKKFVPLFKCIDNVLMNTRKTFNRLEQFRQHEHFNDLLD